MAASATFALKAGVWFRRGRLLMVSPGSRRTACPLSGRNSTYRPVQISGTGSIRSSLNVLSIRAAIMRRGFYADKAGMMLHSPQPVSYTHLRAHETRHDLVCRLLLEKKK